MNNTLFIILVLVLFVGVLFFLAYMENKRTKFEKERLREVVKAIKSKDVSEYDLVLPSDDEKLLPEQEIDNFVPLEEVDPEQLLKINKK